MSLQSSDVEGLVPNTAVLRGKAFGSVLDHEDSDFFNGLIHQYIYSLMVFWEDMETLGCGTQLKK